MFESEIINASSSAIATCDLEGKMTFANPAFLKLWGFNVHSEHLGKSFTEFWMLGTQYDDIMQRLTKKGLWVGELKARRKDGTFFDVQVSAASVLDRNGSPVALTSSSIDITERKKGEGERDLLIENLKEALAKVKMLSGLLPICASCKKIRDDKGYWNILESYIQKNTDVRFSHSMCPECSDKFYGKEGWYIKMKKIREIE